MGQAGGQRRRQVHEPAQMACRAVRAAPSPCATHHTPLPQCRATGVRPVPAKFCFRIFWLSPSCVVLISIARPAPAHAFFNNKRAQSRKGRGEGGHGSGATVKATDIAKLGFVLWPVLCRPSGTHKLPLLRALLNCAKV